MNPPPTPLPSTEIRWPQRRNSLGDKVTYKCEPGGYIEFSGEDGWVVQTTGDTTIIVFINL